VTSDIIKQYFPDLSQTQKDQFDALDELYRFWNARINLVSRKDIDMLYLHHILHSLAIAKVISFLPGEKVLDVGTGGGFPGIPLAIMFPDTDFHLVDSIGKKIKVVQEVSLALGLKNVDPVQRAMSDLISSIVPSNNSGATNNTTNWNVNINTTQPTSNVLSGLALRQQLIGG
jgi:16S rRNA (guanine(527)-N(7))-methyltransferase RsmG